MKFESNIHKARRLGAALSVAVALAGSVSPVSAAEKVSIPIGSAARKSEPLPQGDKIELSLDRAIVLSLQNTLDLDVASLNYERAGFGIGSASGAFDPYVQVDVNASNSRSPRISSIQASEKCQLNLGSKV